MNVKEAAIKYQGQLTTFGVGFVVGYTQHWYISHSIHGLMTLAAVGAGVWGVNKYMGANRKTSARPASVGYDPQVQFETHTIDIGQKQNA